ncbi:Carboxylic ester hydrolase [Fusarium sp. LHS14.1]|nr:Carboxylic ester hydrolase [Fusarium sp. LHS14.1]
MNPKEWSPIELQVPGLGNLTGLCFDGKVCQYMGVPYATIPGRFRRSQPVKGPWPEEKWDGTKLGPFPCQPPRDFYPIPSPERPWVENPSTSSTDCLSLNISVPNKPSTSAGQSLYPVMVFMHGGAFVYAAGGAAIYDGRALADISNQINEPTIIISVNFRLGVFGFLASKEIREYNLEFGEEGVGNYGLWDQVQALRWVQQHIAAFGGDPKQVTLFGQSAGGVSANVHLLRDEPLFSSTIIQSGLLPLCGVLSVEEYQGIYDKLLSALDIPIDLPPRERLQRLIDVDEDKLTAAMVPVCVIPVITFSPCDDGYLIGQPMPKYSDYANFKPPSWCTRIMIGDVANECVIWNKSFRSMDAPTLVDKIKHFVGSESKAEKLMSLYNIRPTDDHDDSFWKVEKFTTDGLYTAVNWTLIRSFPAVYAYHFDVPSPFDNDWAGLAHHSLDNVYVWSLLRDHLPPSHREISAKMSSMWLKFANGQEPWERFDKSGRFMIFQEGQCELKTAEQDAARGYRVWEEIEREGLLDDFHKVTEELCMRWEEITDSKREPKAMVVGEFDEYGIKRKKKAAWN